MINISIFRCSTTSLYRIVWYHKMNSPNMDGILTEIHKPNSRESIKIVVPFIFLFDIQIKVLYIKTKISYNFLFHLIAFFLHSAYFQISTNICHYSKMLVRDPNVYKPNKFSLSMCNCIFTTFLCGKF